MQLPQTKKESLAVWYGIGNPTGKLCNKIFHIAYSIFKTDIARGTKKIVGILYNEKDPIQPNLLYFQMVISLEKSFSLELLLNEVIYKMYNKQMMKRHLLENDDTKKVLDQCLYILKDRTGLKI